MSSTTARRVLLLFAYDSQLKWAHALGSELAARGWTPTYAVPSDLRSFVADEQADALGVGIQRSPWDELLDAALDSDAIVLALQGPVTSRFVQELVARAASLGRDTPVVVTGWVGVIIEKIVAGYLERFASDVVAVSSRADLRVFTETAAMLDLPTDNLVLSGLPLLPSRPEPRRGGPVRTVLFADQPTVPTSRTDRAYVYDRLVEHAVNHPERRVLLKPRHRPGEDTFHVMRHHPAHILAGRDLPENFEIVYEPISELLGSVDLLLTISSTAGLESVGAGVRTAFVGDLGVHEKLGNHVLLPSGLVRSFDALDDLEDGPDEDGLDEDEMSLGSPGSDRLEPRAEWIDDYFIGSSTDARTPAQRIVDRVTEMVAVPSAERPLARAVDTDYFRGRVEVAAYRAASDTRVVVRPSRPATVRVRRSIRTVRWRSGAKGRVLLACHAVLPAGWEDWGWVERLRRR